MTNRIASISGLAAGLAPGLVFAAGLYLVRELPGFQWIGGLLSGDVLFGDSAAQAIRVAPWQFWVIFVGGTGATVVGILDWYYHEFVLGLRISSRELFVEFAAVGVGGLSVFALMAAASLAADPDVFLLPVVMALMFTVACICYDEFVFHRRRCGRYENFLHHLLLAGYGAAFLAWFHWVFARA